MNSILLGLLFSMVHQYVLNVQNKTACSTPLSNQFMLNNYELALLMKNSFTGLEEGASTVFYKTSIRQQIIVGPPENCSKIYWWVVVYSLPDQGLGFIKLKLDIDLFCMK